MNAAFVDTSYYIALLSPADRHHAEAVELGHSLRQRLVVTEFVLLERSGRLRQTAGMNRGRLLHESAR